MLRDTTLGPRPRLEHERETNADEPGAPAARGRRRERERDGDELWTLAVTQALVNELPRAQGPALAAGAADAAEPAADSLPPAPGWQADAADGEAQHAAAARAGSAGSASAASDGVPAELCTEVSDERLGKLRLVVARGSRGIDIVINVADSRVKALIEAERAILMKTLKDAGLTVASVQIGGAHQAGTVLAQDREGSGKARPNASLRQPAARWRTYQGSPEADDADGEGVDLTA